MSDLAPAYPPEPWFLAGELTASAWLVPLRSVPYAPVPGWRPVTLFGRAVVGTVHVRYLPPGVLTYDELMVTALVRRGRRVAVTVLAIWVDSPASLAGGRELWAIPKQLADFPDPGLVQAADGPLADVRLGRGRAVPGRWRVRFSVAQPRAGRAVVSPVAAVGTVALARTGWRVHGPLAFLRGHRPVLGFALRDFRMAFGGPQRRVGQALADAQITAQGWKPGPTRS